MSPLRVCRLLLGTKIAQVPRLPTLWTYKACDLWIGGAAWAVLFFMLQAKQERKCILLTVQQPTMLLQSSNTADGPQPVGAQGESIEMCPRPEAAPSVQG